MEQLEFRQLLAASPLATLEGALASSDDSRELSLAVNLSPTNADATAVLGLLVTAPSDHAMGPALPPPRVSGVDGNSPTAVHADVNARHTGMSLLQLGEGEYTVQVAGSGNPLSSGDFRVEVYLPGDSLNQDGKVDQQEYFHATAAAVQNLGTTNHVARLFFQQLGVSWSQNLYHQGSDADRDGTIDHFDLAQIHQNRSAGSVVVELAGDSGPPVIQAQLDNDTGVSASDGITTDATVSGTISEDSTIASFLVGIDGEADFDLLGLPGVVDPSGDFVLTPENLELINGEPLAEGPHTLRFIATDELGNTTASPTELTFTLVVDNEAPTVEISDQPIDEDSLFEIDLSQVATDPDAGDEVVVTVTGQGGASLPSWLKFDPDAQLLRGTPDNNDVGSVTIEVVATDSQGAETSTDVVITVANVNDPPTATDIENQTADEDSPFELDVSTHFDDIDAGDTLTFTATLGGGGELPSWLSFDPNTQVFSGTPTEENLGTFTVVVEATDSQSASVSSVFDITVANINDDPILTGQIVDQSVSQDDPFQLDVSVFFADPDPDDTLTYEATLADGSPLPAWLNLDATTGVLGGTPGHDDVGELELTVSAVDSHLARASDAFTLEVVNVNDPPTLVESIPDETVAENEPFTIDVSPYFEDVDPGDDLAFAANLVGGTPLPAWIQIDRDTGVLSGLAGSNDVGTLVIEITALDPSLDFDLDTFELTVTAVNDPPTVVSTVPDQTIDQGTPLEVDTGTIFADEDAGDTLTFSAVDSSGQPLPSWLSIDAATGVLSGTPTNDDVGTIVVQVTATDSQLASATSSFTVTVSDVNDRPTVIGTTFGVAPDASAGTVVGTVLASDPDSGDSLTFAIVDGDPGSAFSIDSQSGEIRLEDASQLATGGPFNLTVQVTDSGTPALNNSATITINVTVNNPPTASAIDDQTVNEGETTSFDVSQFFSDPEGDTLTFAATLGDGSQLPSWLSLDSASGAFQVSAPGNDDVGSISVTVTATDTAGNGTLATFDLTVDNVNEAPQIVSVIASQTVNEGEPFQLLSSDFFRDPDSGDVISYSAVLADGSPLPAWLVLTPQGELSGTPSSDDVGNFSITVTATDTQSASAEQTFSLNVDNINDAPSATDDAGLSTDKSTVLPISADQLLANDTDPDAGDTLSITEVSTTSARGASVTLDGDQVLYDPSSSSELAELPSDGQLVDTFQYTVRDAQGATDTATVTVQVTGGSTAVLSFRLETTDLEGNPITAVSSGESFLLRIFTEDLREAPEGVFSPYLDVTYDENLATVTGDIEFGPLIQFPMSEPGTLDTPGLIDEGGAIVGLVPTGPGELLVLSLQFTAGSSAGTVTFASDPADVPTLHDVYFFDDPFNPVPTSQIEYGSTTLQIESTTFAALAGPALNHDPLLPVPSADAAGVAPGIAGDAENVSSMVTGDASAGEVTATPAVDAVHAELGQDAFHSTSDSLSSVGDTTTDASLEPLLSDIADDVARV